MARFSPLNWPVVRQLTTPDRFGRGEVQMDFYSRKVIASQRSQKLVRRTGSQLHWGVRDPYDVLAAVPALRLLNATTLFDAETYPAAARGFRAAARPLRALPPVRKALQYHRYAFGPVS